jgi:spore coat polysaccharide biosynthesis protein SpsF (cytidylyltransferase family)
MKTVAIIQARMGSTRLPGKILKPILGEPMLARMLERVKRAKKLDAVIVATGDKPEDDATAELAEKCGVQVFRGDERDVLDRFYKAAKEAGADTVVRLTGDCALHDPAVIDEVVEHFRAQKCDYTSTPRNYPEGLDAEVSTFSALARAWEDAKLPSEREHVTPYIKNHPELYSVDTAWTSGGGDYSAMHWSVDTEQDFNFVARIYEQLYPVNPRFTKDDVLALLAQHPELLEINKGGTGYEGYKKSLREDEEFKKQHDHTKK